MSQRSADEKTIQRIVEEQIMRDAKNRRGPKRDITKITRILAIINTNDKIGRPALTIKDLNLPDINKDDLEDYLAFLSKFPKNLPFLRANRRAPQDGKKGAPLKEYRFEKEWVKEWRQESKPRILSARISLAPTSEEESP